MKDIKGYMEKTFEEIRYLNEQQIEYRFSRERYAYYWGIEYRENSWEWKIKSDRYVKTVILIFQRILSILKR